MHTYVSSPSRALPRLALALAVLGLAACSPRDHAARSGPLTAEQAWELAGLSLLDDAGRAFRTLSSESAKEEALFGRALTLLVAQPKTETNIHQAARLLTALADEASDPGLRVAARYYLGRVEQVHRLAPDRAAAARIYAALFEEHPDTLFGQLAFIKWSLLELHRGAAEDFEARASAVEDAGRLLTIPTLRKEHHLHLAFARLRNGRRDQTTLAHLRSAVELGVVRVNSRTNATIALVNLAHELGDHETALRFGRDFLAEFPRDIRASRVREILATLPSENPAEAASS